MDANHTFYHELSHASPFNTTAIQDHTKMNDRLRKKHPQSTSSIKWSLNERLIETIEELVSTIGLK